MVSAPHHLASQAGISVLRDGGNAVEATIAMAATLSVVYPHMCGLGGDGFWLVAEPGSAPRAIDACGATGRAVTPELYRSYTTIPRRGALAANTVAGAVAGWDAALGLVRGRGSPLPLERLLEDAIHYAEEGFAVSDGQAALTTEKLDQLAAVPGFAEQFLVDGCPPAAGQPMRLPTLAATLRRLGQAGLDDFYRGESARAIAADMARFGGCIDAADLAAHQAVLSPPLSLRIRGARLFNLPPPTQGLASLVILGLFDRLEVRHAEGFDHLHGLIEATKQAFLVRDQVVTDPAFGGDAAELYLRPASLDRLAARIARHKAMPWPAPPDGGDTVWLGAVDASGRAVSMLQSVFFEFGSGLVLPQTGIAWHNRGCGFSLTKPHSNPLAPRRKPFHTLNPAMAIFDDGRRLVYGTMGGEGQPQTQAAIFTRHAIFGQPLQQAVTAPRWLLGRTWGDDYTGLRLESRFDPQLVEALRLAGHAVELVAPFTPMMGHAGAILRRSDGFLEGAADPRGDGAVAMF